MATLFRTSTIAWTMQLRHHNSDRSIECLRIALRKANLSAPTDTANRFTPAPRTSSRPRTLPPSLPTKSKRLQINPLNQLPPNPPPLLRHLTSCSHSLEHPFPSHIHRIITALRKPILPLPVMRDDGAVHGAIEVLADAPDHHPVGPRRAAVVDLAVLENGEL